MARFLRLPAAAGRLTITMQATRRRLPVRRLYTHSFCRFYSIVIEWQLKTPIFTV